jgi:hypothetical protein
MAKLRLAELFLAVLVYAYAINYSRLGTPELATALSLPQSKGDRT